MEYELVPRPARKGEYTIYFASRQAKLGWREIRNSRASSLINIWHYLTEKPHQISPTCYPLKGSLSTIVRHGIAFERWQIKLSVGDGARIWYWVEEDKVMIEVVHTRHPQQTK